MIEDLVQSLFLHCFHLLFVSSRRPATQIAKSTLDRLVKMDPIVSIFLLDIAFLVLGGLLISSRRNTKDQKWLHNSFIDGHQESHSRSSFLRLPAELWNEIYRLVLLVDDMIYLQRRQSFQPPLLQVCRQTHAEATDILYGGNEFVIDVEDW